MRTSSHDASFLYNETASGPMHGVGISILAGPATYEEIYEYYSARLHLIPRLRQKLVFVPFNLAHPRWVDDPDFLLDNHLKKHVVPRATTLERARDIALKLGEPLLDRTRPLWLTYVLENVEGKTILVQLSHHVFVDGATAVAMLNALTDSEPDAPPPAAPETPWQPSAVPSANELLTEAAAEMSQSGLQLLRGGATAPDLAMMTRINRLLTRMAIPVMQAPWNAGPVGSKRKIATFERQLADFKHIRQPLGGTINDIVVTVVAEGVARYLADTGTVTSGQRLRLMCPVDVRAAEEDPLEMGGNRVSAMFPVLSAETLSIAPRYREVREELDRIKAENEPETLDALQRLQPNLPPLALAPTLRVGTPLDPTAAAARWPLPIVPVAGPRPQQVGFNFTCTNVPGPTWQQYVAGYELEATYGTLMLGGNLGLGVSVSSVNGRFTFVFTVDPRLVPDVRQLCRHVEDCFSELSQVAAAEPGQTHASSTT